MTNKTTDFGYEQIPEDQKETRVKEVFDSVAGKYDLMNDLMSLGVHRLWKRFTLGQSHVRLGQKVLDIAGGTGDLTREFAKRVGPEGQVILADINANMLNVGRDRLIDQGLLEPIEYVQANAEYLPFADSHFDVVSIAFGLRNVTDKSKALTSMFRVLKPGGQLLILEFSKPTLPLLQPVYDAYSFSVLPLLGKLLLKDAASYRYLAESIRMHPDQETLKTMVLDAGFDTCKYHNLSGGIVALHTAYRV